MPNYSALIGFDTTQMKLHYSSTHYIFKAIVVPWVDVQYESNLSFLQATNVQGLVEVQFYTYSDAYPVLMIQLYLVEYFDTQFHVKENVYFHATQPLYLHDQRQLIQYQHEQMVINSEVIVTALNIQGAVRFPLVELNLTDFYFPASQYFFSNFLAVELQTETVKVLKYFCGRCCDLSEVIIPYAQEILVKIVFVVKFYEIQHKFTIFNSKVAPNQALTKGAFYAVTDIDPKFDPSVFSLIDNIITTISSGNDVFKDPYGMSVKLSSILTPGFLNRWLLFKNPKVVDINKPKFQQCPWVIESDNKKLAKIVQYEISACEYLSERADRYRDLFVRGSVMFCIETSFLPKEQDPALIFAEAQPVHKSIAMLASRIGRDSDGFGFLVLSNKEIPHQKLIQEFEIGSGNLAVCAPADKKQFLQIFHRGNPTAIIKLLMTSAKSLIQHSAKGIAMNMLLYEIGFDFQLSKLSISQSSMEYSVLAHCGCIDRRVSAACSMRLYLQDMLYIYEKGASDELPTVPADAGDQETIGELRGSATSFTRQSLASVNFTTAQRVVFEPYKVLSYFGGRTAVFFFVQPRRPLRTFVDSLQDEQRRIQEEERRRKDEEERRRRLEEEEKARYLAEQRMREELERQEQERLQEEKRRREEEEQRLLLEQYSQEMSSSAVKFAQFYDIRKREMDELQRKIMAEKLAREEAEKEELRRKMELKKLRNLKWQQQIQRFIVKDRGYIDTFYNDKMDVEDRKVDEKAEVLPKVVIKTLLKSEKVDIVPQYDMSERPPIQQSLVERAKADLIKLKEHQLGRASTAPVAKHESESDESLEDLIEQAQLRTRELVISPIVYTCRNKQRYRSVHRLLGRLYSSPLNIQGKK